MKKQDVIIGELYAVKVSGNIVPVRITALHPESGYWGRNTGSNRIIYIKTAARIRYPWRRP